MQNKTGPFRDLDESSYFWKASFKAACELGLFCCADLATLAKAHISGEHSLVLLTNEEINRTFVTPAVFFNVLQNLQLIANLTN